MCERHVLLAFNDGGRSDGAKLALVQLWKDTAKHYLRLCGEAERIEETFGARDNSVQVKVPDPLGVSWYSEFEVEDGHVGRWLDQRLENGDRCVLKPDDRVEFKVPVEVGEVVVVASRGFVYWEGFLGQFLVSTSAVMESDLRRIAGETVKMGARP